LLYNACSLAPVQNEGSRKEFEHASLTTIDKCLGKKLIFSVVTNMQNF
jgi:hypothetical protein